MGMKVAIRIVLLQPSVGAVRSCGGEHPEGRLKPWVCTLFRGRATITGMGVAGRFTGVQREGASTWLVTDHGSLAGERPRSWLKDKLMGRRLHRERMAGGCQRG